MSYIINHNGFNYHLKSILFKKTLSEYSHLLQVLVSFLKATVFPGKKKIH